MIGSVTMGEFTSTASSVGRVKGLDPLSKTAIAVLAPPTIGPGERVDTAILGEQIVAKDPKLQAFKAQHPGDARTGGGTTGRGFLIAVGTVNGRQFKPAAMRQALSQIEQVGFDAGIVAMNAPASITASVSPGGGESSSSSSGYVVAGAAIVGLAAVGAVIYKLRNKR